VRYRFPKSIRLRKRRQFQRLANQSKRFVGEWIIVESFPNHIGMTRLGITVTKRFGKAHDRNRFKRIVREAFRCFYRDIPQGFDLIIRPRSKAKEAASANIQADLLSAGHE
jgi:ribonuclease P protein component